MSRITQRGATGPFSVQANGKFQTDTSADLVTLLGSRWDLSDGREVVFVRTGSTNVATAGYVQQDAAVVPNHQNLATVSVTAYSNNGNTPASAVVTLGATAATANQYQGGFAIVNSSTGLGQTLKIASNTAASASGTISVVFEDGPNTALVAAASTICLWLPHCQDVIPFPTTPTNAPAGVAFYTIPAASYGFLISKGLTGAVGDALTFAAGAQVAASVTTVGTVTASTGTGSTIIGIAPFASTSAQARPIFVTL